MNLLEVDGKAKKDDDCNNCYQSKKSKNSKINGDPCCHDDEKDESVKFNQD